MMSSALEKVSSAITLFRSFIVSRMGSDFIALLLILFFFAISLFSVLGKSLTYDEPYHYRYGVNILNGDSSRFDDSKMPFSALNALPAKVTTFLPEGELKENLNKMVVARLITVLFSMIVAFMVFHWSRELYGTVPGLISLGLYVFDPNLIAHSQLITTDIYIAGMILFCSYWLWRFANTRKWSDGLIFAILLGLTQLAKYTAVSLYFLLAVEILAHDLPRFRGAFIEGISGLWKEVRRYLKYFIVLAFFSILIINAGFLFNRTFTYFHSYEFKSDFFSELQSKIDFIVPVPYPYLDGLDWITAKERTDLGFIHIYLLGKTRFGQGFPGYYIVASALKVPIATQLILVVSLVIFFWNKKQRSFFMKNEWFMLWLVFFYSVYFNFFYKSQMGMRYYLLVFPLLYVFAGSLFRNWQKFTRLQTGIVLSCSIFLIASVLSKYPNYLAYFNELIGEGKNSYKYLADSNLDWGQDTQLLDEYKKEHTKAEKAPETPILIDEETTYFVSINRLVGVINGPENYQWLRENFEPVDMVGNSYLIYRITPEKMLHLCASTAFCK